MFKFTNKKTALRQERLPDPFLKPDGTRVKSAAEWEEQRVYLKEMLAHYLYGHIPPESGGASGAIISREFAHNGDAIKETACITCGACNAISFDAVIIRPSWPGRFPVFVWNQFADMSPCPVEGEAIRRGYAIAMFNRNQLAPDITGCERLTGQCVETYPNSDWRAMAIWGWGASRLADYLLTTDYTDADRLITTGHSRGGKAALYSAIYDERFALCAAAGSGCGGAANLRFMGTRLGPGGACESLGDITKKSRYWYWFSDVCADYGNHEKSSTLMDEALLPFDLHFVRALIAPRPLISVDGLDDIWSNPYGITLSWAASEPVYQFLGAVGKNALFVREGGHAYNAADWLAVLNFCDNMLLGKNEAPLYKAQGAEQLCLDGLVELRPSLT
ncbi:MAG: hypothetical protein LBF87_05715 [Treponema sp.]|jgi:hypothetical protein|nr:hypothetical protein [Treponema sp.]